MKKLVVLLWVLFSVLTVSVSYAQDANCLNLRKSFISASRSIPGYMKKNTPHANTNVHEVEDILDTEEFKKLCEEDQWKFKRIVYSTFRLIRVNDEGDEIGFDEKEIYGTLIGDGVLLVTQSGLKEKEILKIKLINYDGEKSSGSSSRFTVATTINVGYNKTATLLLSHKDIKDLNPEFTKKTSIGLYEGEMSPDYANWILSPTQAQLDLFFLGYDDEDMNAGFGLTTVFNEYWENNKLNVSSSDKVSDNIGGGAYDVNFNLIGLHYYNTVYPSMTRFYHVIDSVPSSITKFAWGLHEIDQGLQKKHMAVPSQTLSQKAKK